MSDTNDSVAFGIFAGQLGAFQLDVLNALRAELAGRNIGSDFLRWSGTSDGKYALSEIMARLAYIYRISAAGAQELLEYLPTVGLISVPHVRVALQFEACMFADHGVIHMSDRFRDLFPKHWVRAREATQLFPYCLQSAAPHKDIVCALGTRPYSDFRMLTDLLDEANQSASSGLLTVRSNLFCVDSPIEGCDPCVVELWNHGGWRLDAFAGDDVKLFDPGCRVFAKAGGREKKRI